MEYSVKIDIRTPEHTNLRLFVNHALAGKLCLRNDEFSDFIGRLGIADEHCELCGCDENNHRLDDFKTCGECASKGI